MDDYDDDEPPSTRKSARKECIHWISFQWIKSPLGLLKIVEFVTLLMGIIMIGSVADGEQTSKEFFIFVLTSGWVFVFITLILYILDVYQKLPQILTSNLVMFVGCAIGVIVLLISSTVLMVRNPNDDRVKTGGIFGLISMLMVTFEMCYYLIRWKRGTTATGGPSREEPIIDDMDY